MVVAVATITLFTVLHDCISTSSVLTGFGAATLVAIISAKVALFAFVYVHKTIATASTDFAIVLAGVSVDLISIVACLTFL